MHFLLKSDLPEENKTDKKNKARITSSGYIAPTSLCSKRSRTRRTWENAKEQKGGRRGGGGGERRERLPANPSILKNPFAHERSF